MVTLLTKWKRVNDVLAERLGRAPTPDEVGKVLRLSKKKVGMVAKALRINDLVPHNDGSENDEFLLDEMLTDERSKSPDDLLIESDDLERIFNRLDRLGEREATVIRMRFGLEPYVPMTLREVGENLGLTRERVRQLEKEAMEQLITTV
jgi:RNA polymerase primary sigma factor